MRNTETVIGIVVYAGTAHKINTIHYADKDMNIYVQWEMYFVCVQVMRQKQCKITVAHAINEVNWSANSTWTLFGV